MVASVRLAATSAAPPTHADALERNGFRLNRMPRVVHLFRLREAIAYEQMWREVRDARLRRALRMRTTCAAAASASAVPLSLIPRRPRRGRPGGRGACSGSSERSCAIALRKRERERTSVVPASKRWPIMLGLVGAFRHQNREKQETFWSALELARMDPAFGEQAWSTMPS